MGYLEFALMEWALEMLHAIVKEIEIVSKFVNINGFYVGKMLLWLI